MARFRYTVNPNAKQRRPQPVNCPWCGNPKPAGAPPGKCIRCLENRARDKREKQIEQQENET